MCFATQTDLRLRVNASFVRQARVFVSMHGSYSFKNLLGSVGDPENVCAIFMREPSRAVRARDPSVHGRPALAFSVCLSVRICAT